MQGVRILAAAVGLPLMVLVGQLVLPLPALAQGAAPARSVGTVRGMVVDAATGAALPGARVELLQPHRVESTHADGSFVFGEVPVGTYTLSVSRVGYAPTTRSVTVLEGAPVQLRVELGTQAVRLEAVVVTGTTTARTARDALSATSTVSGAELDRRLEPTVAGTLEGVPGVSVASVGPATARPVIRGLGSDRVLVLEDGQRPGDLSNTSGDHAVAIDPLTARQIEVVRGPMSLLYGSSALGGVVNVVRDEVPNRLPEDAHGTVSLQGSSVDRGGVLGGFATGQIGRRIALRGEVSGRGSGDIETPAGPLINTDTRTFNASVGAAYVSDERGHAGAAYRFYDNHYGIPGGFVGGHEGGVDIDMRRHTVRGEAVLHPSGPFGTLRASGIFTDYAHQELEASGEVGTRFGQRLSVAELAAQHDALGPLAQGALGFRAQLRDLTTGGSVRTPPTEDLNLAGYLVEEWQTGPLRLQVGARYDWTHYDPQRAGSVTVGGERIRIRPRTFSAVSGSAGALYAWGERLRVGASVARAYRTPDFNELYSNGPHLAANSFDVGDPNLGEETGLGVDAFVRWEHGGLRAEVAAFRNQLDGYIFPSSRGRTATTALGRPVFQYTNEDARFVGWEADLEWSITPRLVVDGTVSDVRARFTSDRAPISLVRVSVERIDTTLVQPSRYPPLIPPLNGRIGARYDLRRWFAGGDVRGAARQDRVGDFEEPTAGYAVVDGLAGVRLLRGRQLHTLTLRADNLLNTEYRQHLSRIKAIMPEPGLNLSLLYRVSF